MRHHLSATQVNKAKPGKKPYRLTDGGGLYLLVNPNGGKYWRYDYRYNGRRKTLALGVFPDVTLAGARNRHQEARTVLAGGIDPSVQKRAAQASQTEAAKNTFEIIAREWHETKHKVEVVPEHANRNLRRLERYAFPTLGRSPVTEVQPPAVLEALNRIVAQGHVETAHRVRALIGQVMRYAIATGRATREPTPDLGDALPPSKPKHYAAIVKPEDVRPLLRAIDGYSGQPTTRAALQLAPLLMVRPGELRQANWKDVDLDRAEWHVTAKGGTPLLVPLPKQALQILEELKNISRQSEYVFPGARSSKRPMSNNTINAALRRLDYGGVMTGHGFRAMARTILVERLDFPVEHVEMQLGHRVRDIYGRAYNRAQWLNKRRRMMQGWADYLDRLKSQ